MKTQTFVRDGHTIVRGKALILSANEHTKYIYERIPSYSAPVPSQRAIDNGAWTSSDKDFKGKSWAFTRTSADPKNASSSCRVGCVYRGGRVSWVDSNFCDGCLLEACYVKYEPQSNFVNSCHPVSRTATIWNREKKEYEEMTSEADVVTEEGKDLIWLNKKECEEKSTNLMLLYLPEAPNKSVPFDREGEHSNYGLAEEFRQQCEDELERYIPESLKSQVVTVEFSSEDGYEKATPILEMENKIDDESQMG